MHSPVGSDSSVDERRARFARRIGAALVAGVGLAGLALLAFEPSLAIAGRSSVNDSPTAFITNQPANSGAGGWQADPGSAQPDADKSPAAATGHALSSRAVCVRLCDGSFFPLNGVASRGGEAVCASQCPGAPTQVFYLAAGSDQIENAAASNGQRYNALPVAFRYRTTVDNTCTCGGKNARENAMALLEDPTLRKGDLIMTDAGVRVFRGAHALPYDMNDFVGVAQSTLPPAERDALMAMDRANARSLESPGGNGAGGRAHPAVVVTSSVAP
jgi:hypothetical protein